MGNEVVSLDNQKNMLKQKLYDAKEKREKLNKVTNELKVSKNNLIKKINKFQKEGLQYKEKRDDINRNVAHAKKRRKEFNDEYETIKERIDELRKQYFPSGPSLEQLKKTRHDLEFRQMTHQLKKREEEEIIDQLGDINKQIREREQVLKENSELNDLVKKASDLKTKSDREHQKVREFAEKAQKNHQDMLECYSKTYQLKKELKIVERDYIVNRLNADKAHREFVDYIKQIRNLEDEIKGIKDKAKKIKIEKEKTVLTQQADDIYERFKRGEKLSTEDLLLLQKAGLI